MPQNFNVRLDDDLADQIKEIAATREAPVADVLRDAVKVYLNGSSDHFKGNDAGYIAGRALATRLSFELLRAAQENLPDDYEGAVAFLAQRKPGPRGARK